MSEVTEPQARRIRAHYKAIRKRSRRYGGEGNKSSMWMTLARRWKMPIAELKKITED